MRTSKLVRLAGIVVLCTATLFLPSCAMLHSLQSNNSATSSQLAPPPNQNSPVYYDFQDVPIPQELTLLPKDSQVFQGGGFKSGLLVFRGRVDPGSLIAFFQAAMPRQNWKLMSSVRYRKSVMLFEKPEKACFIIIYEKYFYSYAEVYVLPIVPGMK